MARAGADDFGARFGAGVAIGVGVARGFLLKNGRRERCGGALAAGAASVSEAPNEQPNTNSSERRSNLMSGK